MNIALGILSAILAVAAAAHSDFIASYAFIAGSVYYVWCAPVDRPFWEG